MLDPANGYLDYPYEIEGIPVVQVMHTSAPTWGDPRNLGTINFKPNGGGPSQPGCDGVKESFLSLIWNILTSQERPAVKCKKLYSIIIVDKLIELFKIFAVACAHNRAVDLWTESVRSLDPIKRIFIATNIDDPTIEAQMGNNCSPE